MNLNDGKKNMKQNTEQLKKEFENSLVSWNTSADRDNDSKPILEKDLEKVWNFFLPHLISSDEKEEVFCNLVGHPDGTDCYGQKILTKEQYNLRGVNTEPVCKLTTPSPNEVNREAVKELKEIKKKLNGEPPYEAIIYDEENAHVEADEVLLKLITDEEVRSLYKDIPKWYA